MTGSEIDWEPIQYLGEVIKQLITLSTGILTFTVTFLGQLAKVKRRDPQVGKRLSRMWLLQGLAILFGLIALLIATGQMGRALPDIYTPALRIAFLSQLLCFGAGSLYLWRIGRSVWESFDLPAKVSKRTPRRPGGGD